MGNWTPGPWAVGSAVEGSALDMDRMVYCDDALGSRVADCSTSGYGIRVEQERANARLIAAAPDLVAALDTLIANARLIPDPGMAGVADCYAVPLDDIEAARAALSKARGLQEKQG